MRSARWCAAPTTEALRAEFPDVRLLEGDLRDASSLDGVLDIVQPDEVFNLGGFSSVGRSWQEAELAAEVTGQGVLRLLEPLRRRLRDDMSGVRSYQASSSEMFGRPRPARRTSSPPSTPARHTAWRRRSCTT